MSDVLSSNSLLTRALERVATYRKDPETLLPYARSMIALADEIERLQALLQLETGALEQVCNDLDSARTVERLQKELDEERSMRKLLRADEPVAQESKEPWNDPAGWVDHLIGDGKRDNIIIPMSVALELQALLRARHEPRDGYYTMSQISYALNRSLYAKTGNLAIDGIIEDLHKSLTDGSAPPPQADLATIATILDRYAQWFFTHDHDPRGREMTKLAEQLRAAQPPTEDREDAERWRALINCDRISAMGCAGIENHKGDGFAHLTVNLWTKHPTRETETYPREWLRKFVDIARGAVTKEGHPDPYKRCQHDLLKPATTIEVIDKWKAKCFVCIEFFDLPGRPDAKSADECMAKVRQHVGTNEAPVNVPILPPRFNSTSVPDETAGTP